MTPDDWQAVRLSMLVSTVAMLAAVVVAIPVGWLLARKQFFGKGLVENLANLSLVLPPIVTGYLLLILLGRRGVLGSWLYDTLGIGLTFVWQGAALAAAIMAFPLTLRSTRSAFEQIDQKLEQAAGSLGAGPWRVFWTVTLPLARKGILAGAVIGFARALGEFGATITFAGNIEGETQTIPLAVYTMINRPGGLERSWPLVIASIVLAWAALWIGARLERTGDRRVAS